MIDRIALRPLGVPAASPRRRPVALWLRLALVPVVSALTVVGLWVFAGVITNDFALAMVLTAGWFGLAGLIALVISWWRRPLVLPVLGTFVVTVALVGGYLVYASLVGKTVNEQLTAARPVSEVPHGAGINVALSRGAFYGIRHGTSGQARIVRLISGAHVLQLLDLDTDPGPDLRVYLVAGRVDEGSDAGEYRDVGALKGNRGTQQYQIPAGIDVRRYSTVLIWCRAFSVPFGAAPLRDS